MFDQEESLLLQHALRRATKDYQNNCNVYPISAFDPAFDQQLVKLVIFYSFDFQAIALHLYFKFPQYSSRLKPQAVAYRWYQLTLQQQPGDKQQQIKVEVVKEQKREEIKEEEMTVEQQECVSENQGDKKLQFEAAMMAASTLDEEERDGFMLYSPKFIVDSEFKLQRTPSHNNHLLALLQNDLPFEFGPFEPPQAAPFDFSLYQPQPSNVLQAEADDEEYLDDDWQAYESD